MPPGESGDRVDIGSTSFPMHISAKTENNRTSRPRTSTTSPARTPARRWSTRSRSRRRSTAPPRPATRSARSVKEGWDQLVEDGGLTLYPDWSSPTMLQTMGQTFQEMLAGRISPEEVAQSVQDDWEKYHEQLAGG